MVGDAETNALHQQLGRIEGKLDTLISTISRAHTRIDALEKDVIELKTVQAKHIAYVTLFSVGAGFTVQWVMRSLPGIGGN